MDRDLLAKRLYIERVNELMGDHQIDEQILEQMWENRATPTEAAKAMSDAENDITSGWLQRYLKR